MNSKLEQILLGDISDRLVSVCEIKHQAAILKASYQDFLNPLTQVVEPALRIQCANRESADRLWIRRYEISKTLLRQLGFCHWVIIGLKDITFYSPWQTIYMQREVMNKINYRITPRADVELAKMILDSPTSCAIVAMETNIILAASPGITATTDKTSAELINTSLDDLWADHQQDLDEMHQNLRRQGTLKDYCYTAGSWTNINNAWEVMSHRFRAQRIEAVEFMGQLCRLTYGVEIIG